MVHKFQVLPFHILPYLKDEFMLKLNRFSNVFHMFLNILGKE